uniref:uncharacterized protein LOC120337195 n=1 Tax=Styela clava TaxID=7725 RepID=UPI001939513A|nr:uncharacterized protein LOC120337195 [Styela clava]
MGQTQILKEQKQILMGQEQEMKEQEQKMKEQVQILMEQDEIMEELGQKLKDSVKDDFTGKLQSVSTKFERLKIFTEMHAVGEALSDTIASCIQAIDMSNVALTYNDLPALGFIINHSTTLSMVNFRNCRLPRNSIVRLGNSIKSNAVVINEFNIEKNPDLNVEDFIAGVILCISEGRNCNFICDVAQLTKKDKKAFKAVMLQYTAPSPPQSEKSRRALAMESRIQMPQAPVKRYKKRSGKLYSISIQKSNIEDKSRNNSYSSDQLPSSKTKRRNNTETLGDKHQKSSDATDSIYKYLTESGVKKKVTKYKPRTVAESVKYRKMQRFQSTLSTLGEETSENTFPSNLNKSVKISALASDRTRFQALALKTKKSAGLRRHVKDTHSTILSMKKSTNKDSGFESFSHFSSAVSIRSIQREFFRLNMREDRSRRSEHSMSDNLDTDSAHGSFDSSENLDVSRKSNDYDLKMVGWQRFEMTCKYGLGVMQNKAEKIEKWLNNLESQIEVTTEGEDIRWSELVHMKMDNALRRPEVVYATIGEDGGEVRISSFKIYFPPGAVEEEKKFFFKSCSIPDEQQSKDFFPITPVLTCRLISKTCKLQMNTANEFPVTFAEPVKITMKTFCSPKHADVPVIVFHTNEMGKGGRQVRSQKVKLGQLGAIEIKVEDFCSFKAEVAAEQLEDMEFRIMNNVSIENTKRVTSYFWKDERIISTKDLGNTGSPIVTGFPLPEEIIVSLNSIVSLTMKCENPNDTEVAPIKHSFKVTKKWLKKRHHLEYFRLEELEHDSCRLEIQYTIEATDPDDENDIRGPLPIVVDWPIKQYVPLSETAGPSKSEKVNQRPMPSMRTGDVKADSYIGTQTTNNYTLKVDNAQNIPPALLGIQPQQLAIKELPEDTTKK